MTAGIRRNTIVFSSACTRAITKHSVRHAEEWRQAGPKDNGLCTRAHPSAMPTQPLQAGLRARKWGPLNPWRSAFPCLMHSGVVLLLDLLTVAGAAPGLLSGNS